MNKQQQRKLKKHPLIRLIRGIFRLMRVIFRPARSKARLIELAELERIELERAQIRQAEADYSRSIAEQTAALAEQYITVGDLLDRVQWQSPASKNFKITSATKLQPIPPDVSLN